MRTFLILLIGLMVGVVAATAATFTDINVIQRKITQYQSLKSMQQLQAADIAAVSCAAVPKNRDGGGERARVTVKSGETGWTGLLTALNQSVNEKAAAAKAELEALGVTNVP